MTPTPKLRRFRFAFSLRTLFVVVMVFALVAGWSTYQLNWLRQREAWRQQALNAARSTLPNDAPGLLWVFREHGESWIEIKGGTHEEIVVVQKLFPEAIVIIAGQQPSEQQIESYKRMAEAAIMVAPLPAAGS